MSKPNVSVIIVTWNNEKDISACLESLNKQKYESYKVIVVDNASADKTTNIIKKKFPEVKLIDSKKNLYLTGGNNLGIEYAIKNYNSKYVMVLNPDTKASTNLISALVDVAEGNDKVGAVGPKIKFWNNENEGLLNSTGLVFDGFMQAYDRGILEKDKGQYDQEEEMRAISGTCILYRVETLKQVGLYWNAIKMYLDELELSMRIRRAGWKIIYTPKTTLKHSYMVSTKQNSNFSMNDQKRRAWLFIALRHYPLKSKLAMTKYYLGAKIKG